MSGIKYFEDLENAVENRKFTSILKEFENLLKYQKENPQDLKDIFADSEKSTSMEQGSVIGKALKCIYSTKSRHNMVETLLTRVGEMVDNDEELLRILAKEDLIATLFKICLDKDYLLRVRRCSAYLILGFTSSSTRICKQVAKLIESSKELQVEVQQLGMTFFSLSHYPIQEMLSEFLYRLSRVWKKTPSRHVKKMLSYFPDSFFDSLRTLKGSEFESGLRELLNKTNQNVNENLFSFALKEIFQVIDWEDAGSEQSLGEVEWLDIGSECISVYIKPPTEETSLICIPYSGLEKVEFLERALSIKMDVSPDIENLELLTQQPPNKRLTKLRFFIKGTKKDFIQVRDTILNFLPNEKDKDDSSQSSTDSESKVSGATMKDRKKVASEIKTLQEEASQSSCGSSSEMEDLNRPRKESHDLETAKKMDDKVTVKQEFPSNTVKAPISNNQYSSPDAAIIIIDEDDPIDDLKSPFHQSKQTDDSSITLKVKKEQLDNLEQENIAPNKLQQSSTKTGPKRRGLRARDASAANINANKKTISTTEVRNPAKKRLMISKALDMTSGVSNNDKENKKPRNHAFELSDDEDIVVSQQKNKRKKRKKNSKTESSVEDLSFGAEQTSPPVIQKAFLSKPQPKNEIPPQRRRQKSFPHKIYNQKDKLPLSPEKGEKQEKDEECLNLLQESPISKSKKTDTALSKTQQKEAQESNLQPKRQKVLTEEKNSAQTSKLKRDSRKEKVKKGAADTMLRENDSELSEFSGEENPNDEDQDSSWEKDDEISLDGSQDSIDFDHDLSQSSQKPPLPTSLEVDSDDLGILMKELLNMTREREMKTKKRKAEALIEQGKTQIAHFLTQWSKRSCVTWENELVKVTAYVEKITEEAESSIQVMSEEYEKHVESQQTILGNIAEKANEFQKLNEKMEMTVKSWKQNNQINEQKLKKMKDQSLASLRKDVAAFQQRALAEKGNGPSSQSILSLLK